MHCTGAVSVFRPRVLRNGVEVAYTAGNDWVDARYLAGVPVVYQVEAVDALGVTSADAVTLGA